MKTNDLSSSALYEFIFDNLLDGLAYCQMIFDKQGQPVDFIYIRVNKSFETLTGLKRIEGKKVTEIIKKIRISNPELFEICGRVSLTGKPERFETYVELSARWFLVSVYSPQKKLFVAIFEDITYKKNIEQDLENAKIAARNVSEDLQIEKEMLDRAKARDEAILESIGEGLVVVDQEMKIVLMNRVAEITTGWTSPEVIGKIWQNVIETMSENGERLPINKTPLYFALQRKGVPAGTDRYFYTRKDKTKFPVAITTSPVKFGKELMGAVIVFRDITHEREIDKAKSEFVSLASHQLKTPATIVSLYTERLLQGHGGSLKAKQKEYMNEVHIANQRMIDLVNILLNVSRIETEAFSVKPVSLDVVSLLKNIIHELMPSIKEKHLALKANYHQQKEMMPVDEALLRMMVSNLLTNAIRYTQKKGFVKVTTDKINKSETIGSHVMQEDSLVISISDNGCGIPKNQQNKIFTKFFRADNARMAQADGTGLGLYIVKSILVHTGGEIWFSSKENKPARNATQSVAGGGTTFYLAIPLRGMKQKVANQQLNVFS